MELSYRQDKTIKMGIYSGGRTYRDIQNGLDQKFYPFLNQPF